MATVQFVTLGLTVLDDIHFPSSTASDTIGGCGVYCALGARLHLPLKSSVVGWMIRMGRDFPLPIKDELLRWKTTLLLHCEDTRPSTRGEIRYQDTTFGSKSFQYVTEPLQILPQHIRDTPLLSARIFHILATPADAELQCTELLRLRKEAGVDDRPLIIWEPLSSSCTPENLTAFRRAAKFVDVFSPNHVELAALFGAEEAFDRKHLELLAADFADGGEIPEHIAIIIRVGAEGCCLYTRTSSPTWLPAYHPMNKGSTPSAGQVVDTTGAGNAFLGGYAIGLLETGDMVRAAYYGAVSASFALEQIGVPDLKILAGGRETWNGASVGLRLENYELKVSSMGSC